MGDGLPRFRQLAALGSRVQVSLRGGRRLLFGLGGSCGGREGLDLLGAVAVDGHGLCAQPPGLDVGVHDLFHRGLFRHVDGFRDGAADEGLHRRHHLQVAAVLNGAPAVGGLERAVKHRQVLFLQMRRGFDGAGAVNVVNDVADLIGLVTQALQGHGDGVVDDLDDAAAHQPLVFHQGEVGLDAGGVAVHHESDGAGGSNDGGLGVAVAELLARGQRLVPGVLGRGQQRGGDVLGVDAAQGVAVQGDDVQHSVPVLRIAGEGAGNLSDAGTGLVGLAGHQGGEGSGQVAPGVAVVRQSGNHQQRAQVGVAQAQRPVVVRVALNLFGGIAGAPDDDFHGRNNYVHCVPELLRVKVPRPVHKLHQVERRQVAGRVVQKHVLRAGIGGIDAAGGFAGVPTVDGGVVLHAGVAALMGGFGNLAEQVAGAKLLSRLAGHDRAGPPGLIFHRRPHELIGHAHGVVGVLEKDRAVGLAVNGGIIAQADQRPGFALLARLAADELFDVGVVNVEDDHLGGAASLAARLDDAGEGVEPFHEADRPGGGAAAGEGLGGAAQVAEVGAGAGAPLEEHAFALGKVHDGFHAVVERLDEAGRALRPRRHTHVEPDRGVESDHLVEQQVGELVAEDGVVFSGGKVAAIPAPVGQGVGHAADQLAHARFALRSAAVAVEVFAGDDIGGGLRPIFGDLHVMLLEDNLALLVGDGGGALLPLHLIVGGNALAREQPMELQTCLCLCTAGKDFPFTHDLPLLK